jgi:hypothetical protein
MDARNIERFTQASDVTSLVVDLKTSLLGAPLRQRETLKRFGVTNLILRPFEDVRIQRAQNIKIMRRLLNWKGTVQAIPAAAKVLGVAGIYLTAEEASAALRQGELDRAVDVMAGVSLLTDTAHAVGDEMEERAQRWEDRLGVSRRSKQQQIDEIDNH